MHANEYNKAARLTFASDLLAAQAAKLLDRKLIKGDAVRAILLQNEVKANRMIIRNLPWLVGEKRIHLIFRDCCKPVAEGGGGGTIVKIDLPKGEDGKSKGFGFISFSSLAAAELSLKKTGTILNARPIAVDWALAKDDYLNRVTLNLVEEQKAAAKAEAKAEAKADSEKKAAKAKAKAEAAAVKAEADGDVSVKKEEGAEDADMLDLAADKRKNKSILSSILGAQGGDSDSDDEQDAKSKTAAAVAAAKKSAAAAAKVKAEEDGDAAMDGASDDESDSGLEDEDASMDGSDDDDEDDEDEDSDSQAESDDDHDDDAINMSDSDSQASDSDSDSDDEKDKEKDEEEVDDAAAKRAKALASKPSDTLKGCTIFIRNLAYDTTEANLLDKFAQFGEVRAHTRTRTQLWLFFCFFFSSCLFFFSIGLMGHVYVCYFVPTRPRSSSAGEGAPSCICICLPACLPTAPPLCARSRPSSCRPSSQVFLD